jgi:hypothetical protein
MNSISNGGRFNPAFVEKDKKQTMIDFQQLPQSTYLVLNFKNSLQNIYALILEDYGIH